ncbi:MAG TPA: M48 family metalloprotease [Beijerinckiaceae bacterium]|jgi:Zn-dependent protease with chaperone function|nr:peptidase Ste24p [Microvirga sp.]HZB38221.1 M48 family metalloprotease [Beijerinckiaceae bacterium]
MLRVHGFYGHVRRNDLRSLAMFAGFVVAFQIVAAVALLPPLLFLDIAHAPFFLLGYVERYVPIVFVLGLGFFVVRFSRHVASVQATVAFAYIDRRTDPRLVNVVETLALAAGLPAPKVGLIETPARNAFACGLSPSSAVVVVTRGLLEALDDDELAAVVAHEIAHIKNGDIRLMAAANVLMENLQWVQRKSLLRGVGWKTAIVVVFMPALLLLFAAAGFVTRIGFTIARASRLLISSSREFVADAEAVRLTHNPAALIAALRRIEGRSAVPGLSPQADAMMIDGAVEGPFASHPTIAERIAVLARLSGAWAEAAAPRKDTRTALQRDAAVGPWGAAPAPAAAEPARFLVQRVNAGIKENIYVITPGAKLVLAAGFALLVIAVFLSFGRSDRASEGLDAERHKHILNTVGEANGRSGSGPVGGAAEVRALGAAIRAETKRLSALDPREARCFATASYWVGDRGLRRLKTPDPKLVEAYARREARESSGIVLEQYLAWKERSVRDVPAEEGAELDAKLLAYVKTRKVVIEILHRFFGKPGLSLIQETYDSLDDRAVLESLRRRLDEGAPGLVADKRVAAEIALLVSAPESFIPCLARAAAL